MSEEPSGHAGAAGADAERAGEIESVLLGRPASLGREEVTRGARVPPLAARKFWHALGFQVMPDEEPILTEADVDALRRVVHLIQDEGMSEEFALAMTRALGRTVERLAVWQTQLVAEALAAEALAAEGDPLSAPEGPRVDEASGLALDSPDGAQPDLAVAKVSAEWLVEHVDELGLLLQYSWRRHLTSALARMLTDAGEGADHLASAPPRVVGFADLVSFTALVARASEQQVATLVQRFEMLASDVVTTHGGRIIKTVGDEVLFAHTDVPAAAAIALDLVAAIAEDDVLPEVRVGMAQGRVVSRLGDVFGTTVNTASRLTAIAPPGSVYVDDTLAGLLRSVSGFAMTELRRRHLRGIGMVTPSQLRRAPGERRTVARAGGG